MLDKKTTRQRRARRGRMKVRELGAVRLCVGRSLQHIYAQLIIGEDNGDKVVASASTLDKGAKAAGAKAANIKSAAAVGKMIAERAIAAGYKKVAFDRSGFKYHGCVKALADAAREGGLEF